MSLAVMPSQFLRIKDVCTLTAISQSHVYAFAGQSASSQAREDSLVLVRRTEDVQERMEQRADKAA